MGTSDAWYNQRVSENLRREILWAINHELRDPDLPATITVPSIKLSPDTRNATVFISVFGSDEEKDLAIKTLNKAAKTIQVFASKKVKIKNFPKLIFKLDNSFENIQQIDSLLKKIEDDLDK